MITSAITNIHPDFNIAAYNKWRNQEVVTPSVGPDWNSLTTDNIVYSSSVVESFYQYIRFLEDNYKLTDRAEVSSWLRENSFLLPFLLKLPSDLRSYFTMTDKPNLAVANDLDNSNDVNLLVFIPTELNAASALKELKTFDYHYWSGIDQKIQNKLLVDVEFV